MPAAIHAAAVVRLPRVTLTSGIIPLLTQATVVPPRGTRMSLYLRAKPATPVALERQMSRAVDVDLVTRLFHRSCHESAGRGRTISNTAPLVVSRADAPAVALDDGLHDREPEAAAAGGLARGVHLVEALEDERQVLLGNARTGVTHASASSHPARASCSGGSRLLRVCAAARWRPGSAAPARDGPDRR